MSARHDCTCCRRRHSAEDWAALPFVGEQLTEDETGRYRLELRNCPCGSTLGIEERLGPPSEEALRFAEQRALEEQRAFERGLGVPEHLLPFHPSDEE